VQSVKQFDLLLCSYMNESLGMACLRGLAGSVRRVALVDAGMGGRKIKAGLLLGAGLALARRIKRA
jgi:hypothetical protein